MGIKKNKPQKRKGSALLLFLIFIGIPFLAIRSCTASPQQISNAVENNIRSEDIAEKITSAVEKASGGFAEHANASFNKKANVYELTGPVVDSAKILSSREYSELDSFLRQLDQNTGVQIAVLTVDSLNGEDIESFSMRHAEAWKLGKKGVDNGALLTVALEEHDVRIETGYGTEGALTDAKCARILRNVIIPEFKQGDYGEGIIEGVKNMAGVITSDDSLVSESVKSDTVIDDGTVEDKIALGIFLAAFIFIIVFSILASIGRTLFPHSPLMRWLFMTRMLSNGPRNNTHNHTTIHSSGSSFGGFRGGGGGFGGGGASGHW